MFVRAFHILADLQVVVEFFQRLQTFGQIFAVDFLIEGHHVEVAQTNAAVDVKSRALFDQIDGDRVTEMLLRDVLERNRIV